MDLLQNLLDTCTTLTKRVENLEHDKVAQALEITKLKQRVKKLERRNNTSKLKRVKKLERRNNTSKLKRLKKVGTTQRIETSDDTVMDDVSKQGRMIADMDADVDIILKDAKEVVVEKRKRVVIWNPQETATPSTIFHTEAKSKDKGKGILVEEPKPLKRQAQIEQDNAYARELEAELNKNIDWDEVIDHVQRKQKEDNDVKRYQALKRKPQTEAQARKNMMIYLRTRKNMMIYLRNVAGFKMDYFNGMTYDDIRPIFEKHFNSNVAFLQKTKEQMDEEDSRALKRLSESQEDKVAKKHKKLDKEVEELKRHLQIVPNDDDDVYTEATPLALKVPVVDYEIYNQNNKPYYKIKRADARYTSSNLEKSKKCSWSSEGQELKAVRVLWCADYHIHYNTVDFVGREEISTYKVHSGSNAHFGVDAAEDFKENMLSV
nr:hypothetical protein [Tanacetum cinerariifolium]